MSSLLQFFCLNFSCADFDPAFIRLGTTFWIGQAVETQDFAFFMTSGAVPFKNYHSGSGIK